MGWISFGAENHFIQQKQPLKYKKYLYLPSLLLSISMGEKELM
jgi:hypothetical protein